MENNSDFDQFWSAYPRKEGRKDAIKAWSSLTDPQKFAARESIPVHVRYWNVAGRSKQYIPMCGTWLRGERWTDELEMPEASNGNDWMKSTAGIAAKAKEIGVAPRAGEGWMELKARVLGAMKAA